MTFYYLDASAWVKRHQAEAGSAWINRLWRPERRFACAGLGLIEVLCTVTRRHASQGLPEAHTRRAMEAIRRDFDSFGQIALDATVLRVAEELAIRRRVRGADCVHLASAMRLRDLQQGLVVFVAADVELLRAASAEGFAALDPATDPPLPKEP
jgi:predicted nucleic acid-binding protein